VFKYQDKIDLDCDMTKFKGLVKDFAEASSILIDVWEIKLTLDEKFGEIIEINTKEGKTEKVAKINENVKVTTLKKSFISYFSLGYDARVGFGFEKSRTQSRCCNHCLFFWENCKKSCCRSTINLDGFIDSFYTVKVENSAYMNNSVVTERENLANKELIFKSKDDHSKEETEQVVLKGEPICLIGQNVNFYLGKADNLWKTNDKIGLALHNPNVDEKNIELQVKEEKEKEKFEHLIQNEQNLNDSKLEFLTYQNGFCGINCEKIYQGTGPVVIKFKDTPEKNEHDKHSRVYLNIDGNYYHIVKPLEMRVRLNTKYPQRKLKFLCKHEHEDN